MSNLGKTIPRTVLNNSQEHQRLRTILFGQVQNPDDWKAPIDVIVPERLSDLYIDTIIHFTGTVPDVSDARDNPGHVRLTSIGYRMGPCGDH